MKKMVLSSLVIVFAMVLPMRASLTTSINISNKTLPISALPTLSKTEAPVQKISLGTQAESQESLSIKKEMVLSLNSGMNQGNPLASTELRINLDNFDMEYVLKVQ